MTIGSDFEIQNDKDIRYVGAAHEASGAGYYTVFDLHDWLRDLADDATLTGDDYMDITRETPSEKSYETIITLINSYNVDDTAAEHLYQGSIIQTDGDEIYDGIQIIAAEGCHVEIAQNGSLISNDFWNSTPYGESTEGLNRDVANGIACRFMVKVRTAGADIDGRRILCQTREWGKTFSEFKINGTSRGVNVAALNYADDINNQTAVGTVAGWTTITNETAGYVALDVDNNGTDEYYYSEWNRATYTINQMYERMKWLARRGTSETLYGLNGELFRGITHEVPVENQSATDWTPPEAVSWTGGTGQLLAVDDVDASTKLWIQLLSGVAPTDTQTITGGSSNATADVNGSPTERTISTPFCGQSTGSAIIGAYGYGVEVLDLSALDTMRALDNVTYQPPNYVTFTVQGLVNGEDYVLVAPRGYRFAYDQETSGPFTLDEALTFTTPSGTGKLIDLIDNGDDGFMIIRHLTGSVPTDDTAISGDSSGASAYVNGAVNPTIDIRQFTLDGALTGGTVTSVVVTEAIPADTPATGTLRIVRASGKYTRHPYSAWDGPTKTFTITSHDFSTDNAPDDGNVYLSYIDVLCDDDNEAFTAVYSADRALFIRVRDGGATPIKTFETTGVLGSAGGASTAVRTSDA